MRVRLNLGFYILVEELTQGLRLVNLIRVQQCTTTIIIVTYPFHEFTTASKPFCAGKTW